MIPMPWRPHAVADPNREYVALLSYLVRANPARRFWTLWAWEDQDALLEFVHTAPHGRIMRELIPHMGATQFEQWKVKGSELPLAWKPALARILPR